MIAISKHKLDNVISSYKPDFNLYINRVEREITKLIKKKTYIIKGNSYKLNAKQEFYLRYLRVRLTNIAYSDSFRLSKYANTFDKFINSDDKKRKTELFIPFKNKLINIMGYEKLRTYKKNGSIKPIYPQFFNDLGIKACVYCNSNLTITIKQENKEPVARFQVDHFIDKASYPCFSISFFNLYPVCSSCNNKKGNKPVDFDLYSNNLTNTIKSDYKFLLSKKSIAEFRLTKDISSLIIMFQDRNSTLNQLFAIEEIYNTQKDLAAEIIIKSEIYNESYKKTLQNSFSKLYGKGKSSINFNRIILGNYTEPKEIHKRPFSKFTQDIAKQLGLI
jgi:hypothetical protein